jgi:hypothetical protein
MSHWPQPSDTKATRQISSPVQLRLRAQALAGYPLLSFSSDGSTFWTGTSTGQDSEHALSLEGTLLSLKHSCKEAPL